MVLNHNETGLRHERVHEEPMLAGTGLYQIVRSFEQDSPTALKGDVHTNQDGRTARTSLGIPMNLTYGTARNSPS